jgi:hypothetical protein
VLVDAMPSLMLIKTKANPDSLPIEAFDGSIRRDLYRCGDRRLAILEKPRRRAPDSLFVSSRSLRYGLARETLLMRSAMSYSKRSRMPTGRLPWARSVANSK